MANNFALNDAAMALPRPRLAAPVRAVPPLQIADECVPASGSSFGIAVPRSRTPTRTGELALSQSQIAQVSRHVWPDSAVGVDENAVPARLGNLRRNERGEGPHQWVRYLNQSTVDIEHENKKLRLEFSSAIRWIKLREQWWADGVHNLQTAARHEVQSLDLLRCEGA